MYQVWPDSSLPPVLHAGSRHARHMCQPNFAGPAAFVLLSAARLGWCAVCASGSTGMPCQWCQLRPCNVLHSSTPCVRHNQYCRLQYCLPLPASESPACQFHPCTHSASASAALHGSYLRAAAVVCRPTWCTCRVHCVNQPNHELLQCQCLVLQTAIVVQD